MTKKYKILGKYIKDMSSETPDIETYIFVRDYISKYQLNIVINSKALKNKMIEINTILKFEDKQGNKKKSHFEINYISIIKINENVVNKDEIKKIVLCDLQNIVYPKVEKIFLEVITSSGFPGVKIEKKIDFNKLYSEKN